MRLRTFEIGLFGALLLWLFGSAFVVQVDYYDAFDSICNALLFLGEADRYQATRGPLIGLLLVPARSLQLALELHPLDLRPAHFTSALLHAAYLLGIYRLLTRVLGRSPAVLFAFAISVPCMLFFTLACFVSHDLLPGLFLLWMLLLAEEFVQAPTRKTWLLLVGLGAAGPLIKHTFGLFWMLVFAAQVILFYWRKSERPDSGIKGLVGLAAGGLASGALVWLVLAWAIQPAFPEASFLVRPAQQLHYMLFTAPDQSQLPAWVYLRNIAAFGWLPVLLILPSLWLAFSGTRLQRAVALSWVMVVVIHHVLNMREVRYLVVLCPLSAMLLVPVVEKLLADRRLAVGALALWLIGWLPVHPYSPGREAWRCFGAASGRPFYQHSVIREFLAPLDDGTRKPVITNVRLISSAPGDLPCFPGDIYHRLFHFGHHQLQILYGLGPDQLIYLPGNQFLELNDWPAASVLLLANEGPYIHSLSWNREPPQRWASLEHQLLLSEARTLRHDPKRHHLEDGMFRLEGEFQRGQLLPQIQAGGWVPLQRSATGDYFVRGVGEVGETFKLRSFNPHRRLTREGVVLNSPVGID